MHSHTPSLRELNGRASAWRHSFICESGVVSGCGEMHPEPSRGKPGMDHLPVNREEGMRRFIYLTVSSVLCRIGCENHCI